jgi:uncharacterized protein YbcI
MAEVSRLLYFSRLSGRRNRGRDLGLGRTQEQHDRDVGTARKTALSGGELLAAISNGIVGNLREHYGRGPMKAKTYAIDDIVVVVMRGSGFTPLEKTIMESDRPDRVIAMRRDFQRDMADRYKQTIEDLTGRKVVAFLSQAHIDPDITIEVFFVDGPLDGFGSVEITHPNGSDSMSTVPAGSPDQQGNASDTG